MTERIYVQTNDADAKRDRRCSTARPTAGSPRLGNFDTGGRGTGKPHLPSQSSVVLNGDGAWLLVTNAGSDDISLFASRARRAAARGNRVASGGSGADQHRRPRWTRLRPQQRRVVDQRLLARRRRARPARRLVDELARRRSARRSPSAPTAGRSSSPSVARTASRASPSTSRATRAAQRRSRLRARRPTVSTSPTTPWS